MERIVAYMYLQKHYPEIKYNKSFSQKRICKYDITQNKDGPSEAKCLNIKKEKYNQQQGWVNVGGELKYNFDNGWQTNIEDICLNQQYEEQITKHFSAKEQELKHDYKAKIQYMNKYFQEIDQMYKIGNQKESISNLRALYKKSREELKPYIKYKGQRFYEIVPLLNKRKNTVIEEFQAFQPLCTVKVKEKKKYLDDLFKHLNKKNDKEDQSEREPQKIEYQKPQMITPKITRTMSIAEQITEEASQFNQNQYLFEVKDINSFGQQVRYNKMNKILNDMFKSQKHFQNDLQQYGYNHLNSSNSVEISYSNLNQLQQSYKSIKQKELRRMHQSCEFLSKDKNTIHTSPFQTTATSHIYKF